jgi:two-component system cell cycle sensor histidine kinase/response regulator CckA
LNWRELTPERGIVKGSSIPQGGQVEAVGMKSEEPSESRGRPRILLLDKNSADAELSLRELARAGFELDSEIVSTAKEFIEKLQSQRYDVILADYRLPEWTGLDALRWLRNSGYDTPFILVTGIALGDDLAVECIKEGATDYVLKEKLDRLPRACRRALKGDQLRLERDRAEKELRKSEEQYRLLFDTNPLPMWVFDRDTLAFLAVNEAAVRHYGFSRREFFAMTIKDIMPEEDIPALLGAVFQPSEGLSSTEVWRHRKKDGTVIDVEVTSHGLSFHGRKGELVLAHDITDQKRDQDRLRQSEERFAKAFRSSPLAITISTQEEGQYVEVNDAFLNMLGYQREEVIGRTDHELTIWAEPGERAAFIQQLVGSGRITAFPVKMRTRSGDTRLTEVSAELIELDGKPCILAIKYDATEAKHLEEQFRQAQKMEAVGRLAGGIAHDFNNMLSVIIGYSELLQERFETGPERKSVDEVKKAAERAAALTRRLLAFSRQQVLSPRVLNLNAVVDNLSKMLSHMIGEDIELAFTPGASLGNVRTDLVQMEQVIMNLAVNARDAMPHGGRLTIETSNAEVDAMFASSLSLTPGSYVVMAVSDTGFGMEEGIKLRIFEPFFTTKETGKGSGLGLSMVYGVVKQSAGSILVSSEPGRGTTFRIYLPQVDEALTDDSAKAEAPLARGTGTILVVEDEEPLRILVASVLENSGYKVLQASGGKEALKLAKEHGHIDLLVTDVVMPGLNGRELADLIRATLPDLKLLYMSGYASDPVTQRGALASDEILLEKPFTKNSLLTKVKTVLRSRQSTAVDDLPHVTG